MKAISLFLAGIALAGAAAGASAVNPDRARAQAAGNDIAKNASAAPSKQPKTMAQSDATHFRTTSGGSAVRVATDLWSTLRAQPDAQGRMQVVESDAGQPAKKAEGLPHE